MEVLPFGAKGIVFMNTALLLLIALAAGQPELKVDHLQRFMLNQSKLDGPEMLAPATFKLDESNLDGQDELESNQEQPVAIWDESKWDEAVWQ